MKKQEIKNKLLKLISKELENANLETLAKNNLDEFINTYFIMCSTENINLEIVDLQNKLLMLEDRQVVEFEKLKNKIKTSDKYLSLKIKTDYTVLFSNNLIENMDLNSIDNYIILNAGIQIKKGLADLFKEDGYILSYKNPYIVNGYNLPCKKLCKLLYSKEELTSAKDVNNVLCAVDKVFQTANENSRVVIDLSCFEVETKKLLEREICKITKNKIKIKKIKLKFVF